MKKTFTVMAITAIALLAFVGTSFAIGRNQWGMETKKGFTGQNYSRNGQNKAENKWAEGFDFSSWKALSESTQIRGHVVNPANGFIPIEANIPKDYQYPRVDHFYRKGEDESGKYIDMVSINKAGAYWIDRYWALCGQEKIRREEMASGIEAAPEISNPVAPKSPQKAFVVPQKEVTPPQDEKVKGFISYGDHYVDYKDVFDTLFTDQAAYDALCDTNIRFVK